MLVYTLTTQYANNMGALLQCYALSKYLLENEGIDCKVLDYRPLGANRSWALFNRPRSIKDFVKNIYCILNPILFANKIQKNRTMKQFIRNYIPLTEREYHRSDIETNPPFADAFICGSDQIWNFKYRCDLTYFFDFADKDKSKIIAYAPSIADPWTDEKAAFIAPYLKRFDCLSIREQENLEQVRALSPDNNPVVAADPVFLLEKMQWDDIADDKRKPDEPYIFCYFLSVPQLAVETVKKMRELTGLKVLHFNLNAFDKFKSDYNIRNGNPNEFIALIKNATYVCTNSFHCSAFSIIYRKNFVFVPKHMANERISNLVKNFGLSNVFVTQDKVKNMNRHDLIVDYQLTDKKGKEFIDSSKEYLHKALFSSK